MRYWYRQQYNLPPTDPRYLATTDLQIELEWEAWKLAHPKQVAAMERETEAYRDPNYEAVEKEALEEDEEAPVQSDKPTDADVEAAYERLAALQRAVREQVEHGTSTTSAEPEWEDVPLDGGDTP